MQIAGFRLKEVNSDLRSDSAGLKGAREVAIRSSGERQVLLYANDPRRQNAPPAPSIQKAE